MPKYFFDVRTPSGVVCSDYQGLDCPDAAAALAEAQHGARFVTPDDCARNPIFTGYKFAVTDEAHELLFTVPDRPIVIDGALRENGMMPFNKSLSVDDAEAIRSYLTSRANELKKNPPRQGFGPPGGAPPPPPAHQ